MYIYQIANEKRGASLLVEFSSSCCRRSVDFEQNLIVPATSRRRHREFGSMLALGAAFKLKLDVIVWPIRLEHRLGRD